MIHTLSIPFVKSLVPYALFILLYLFVIFITYVVLQTKGEQE